MRFENTKIDVLKKKPEEAKKMKIGKLRAGLVGSEKMNELGEEMENWINGK
ncbi:hypothetical protein [Methanosarcina acetivorans]|uniref:hypothetical protein n=1 Tax=Methanosarcina acetivorans TaxID=2214 RepID=UPI000A52AF03|nr:hypothetical protein [Methanosarcina acetivorans]